MQCERRYRSRIRALRSGVPEVTRFVLRSSIRVKVTDAEAAAKTSLPWNRQVRRERRPRSTSFRQAPPSRLVGDHGLGVPAPEAGASALGAGVIYGQLRIRLNFRSCRATLFISQSAIDDQPDFDATVVVPVRRSRSDSMIT